MTFEEWQNRVPSQIRDDALWKMEAYRISLFLADLAWSDSGKLMRDKRSAEIADQLVRASAKISAHVAEGYSRGTGRDRSRFYEYGLGSAREARDWYYKARHVLGEKVMGHRIDLSTQLTKLLMRMVSNERRLNQRLGKEA